MQEADGVIAIFDKEGNQIDERPRSQIHKARDILKQVTILVINGENQFLATKSTDTLLPSFWHSTAAGLVRINETEDQAAQRTARRELGYTKEIIKLQSSKYYDFSHNMKRHVAIYIIKANNVMMNPNDIKDSRWVGLDNTRSILDLSHPALIEALRVYKSQL